MDVDRLCLFEVSSVTIGFVKIMTCGLNVNTTQGIMDIGLVSHLKFLDLKGQGREVQRTRKVSHYGTK